MTFRDFFQLVVPQMHLNKSLRILVTINTLMVFVVGIFAPFYAVYVQKIGGSIAFVGLSWAILQLVSGVLTLLFSKWSLRVHEQELLLALGYVIRGVVFLSYAFMAGLGQLLVTQVLWGIAAAIGVPAFDAVYAAHTNHEESIAQWGGWEGVASIATGLAALAGGFFINTFGFTPIFFVMAFVCFALGFYIWRLPREIL